MQEGDPLPFGPEAWVLVDEADAGGATAGEGALQVVNGEADVMDSGPALGDEFPDGGIGDVGLQEFDEGLAGGQSDDPGPVGVIERHLGHPEHLSIEGQDGLEGRDRDADVGESGAAGSSRRNGHVGRAAPGRCARGTP